MVAGIDHLGVIAKVKMCMPFQDPRIGIIGVLEKDFFEILDGIAEPAQYR